MGMYTEIGAYPEEYLFPSLLVLVYMSSLVVHIYVKEVLIPFSFHLDFMSCLTKIQPTSLVNVFTSGAVASSRSGQKCADKPKISVRKC